MMRLTPEQSNWLAEARHGADAVPAGKELTTSEWDRRNLIRIVDALTAPPPPDPNAGVVFVDTETTGLDPDLHQIWEVALIDVHGEERIWHLPVDLGHADPVALRISRYHERHGSCGVQVGPHSVDLFAREFAALTRGKHLVGAVVSFDAERLAKLLRANGECPEWHYHLIDVEALAVGFLSAHGADVPLPWDSQQLTELLGLEVPDDDVKHTAVGDARWARQIYNAVFESVEIADAEIVDDETSLGRLDDVARALAGRRLDRCNRCAHGSGEHRAGWSWRVGAFAAVPLAPGLCPDCVDCEPF